MPAAHPIPGTFLLLRDHLLRGSGRIAGVERAGQPLDRHLAAASARLKLNVGRLLVRAQVDNLDDDRLAVLAARGGDIKRRVLTAQGANAHRLVMAGDHLLRVIRRHAPGLLRSVEKLALIPEVVILPVGLQAVSGAVQQHFAGQAFDHVEVVGVAQGALQIMAHAVFFQDAELHLVLRIDGVDQGAQARDELRDLLGVAQVVAADMHIPQDAPPVDNVKQFLERSAILAPLQLAGVVQPGRDNHRQVGVFGGDGLENGAEQGWVVAADEAASIGQQGAFFVADLQIADAEGRRVAVGGAALPPGRLRAAVQVFNQVGGILGEF